MAGLVGGIFLFKVVEDIAYTQTIAGNLIGIGRTNALAGGTYLVLALLGLIGGIEQTMGGHDEMGLLGDMQALLQTPLPMIFTLPPWKMPEGMERSTYFWPSNSSV